MKRGCKEPGEGCRSPGAGREPALGDPTAGRREAGAWQPHFLALHLESPVGVSCCSALQAEAAPASLPHIVLGSAGRMSLAKNS